MLGATIDTISIGLDGVALLVPGLPGGAGAVIKATRGMQGVKNNIQALQSFKRGAQATARLARWSDIGIHGASGYHAYQNDSWLGMGLSAFGVSIRGVQGVSAARNFLTHHPRWNPANWVHRIPHQQGQGRVYAGSLGGGLQQWYDSLWFGYVPPGWIRRPSGLIVPDHLANLPAPVTKIRVVSDAGTFLDRVPPGHRVVLDDVLAQSNIDLVLPKAIRSEVSGATDIARMESATASIEAVRSANVAHILRTHPEILSRKFGLNDLKLVATAKQKGLPVITTNAKLKVQISSHADRQALFGGVKILVPGVDFSDAASLRAILGL